MTSQAQLWVLPPMAISDCVLGPDYHFSRGLISSFAAFSHSPGLLRKSFGIAFSINIASVGHRYDTITSLYRHQWGEYFSFGARI